MASGVPRKKRNIKAALSASAAAGVDTSLSNCSVAATEEALLDFQLFGYGKDAVSYTSGQTVDVASQADQAKQVDGKNSNGVTVNLKDIAASSLIANSIAFGLSSSMQHHYFDTTGTGVTGSNLAIAIYSKDGPQSAYVPQLVGGKDNEYVFFLPSSVTGANGVNMPAVVNQGFRIGFAGAVGAGESVQAYTSSADGTLVATGSAFTYSGSFCSSGAANYQTSFVNVPTGNLDGTGQGGIVVKYTASYAETDGKQHTPYAGLVVTITPANLGLA